MTTANFDGDFDLMPFRAYVLYGEVPFYPIEGDFEHAVSALFHNADDAAAHWRVEAVRWRRANGGAALDLKAIALATAARLFARRDE